MDRGGNHPRCVCSTQVPANSTSPYTRAIAYTNDAHLNLIYKVSPREGLLLDQGVSVSVPFTS